MLELAELSTLLELADLEAAIAHDVRYAEHAHKVAPNDVALATHLVRTMRAQQIQDNWRGRTTPVYWQQEGNRLMAYIVDRAKSAEII